MILPKNYQSKVKGWKLDGMKVTCSKYWI